jgi:molybdopterin/thiamine biosynthesis adenylyltransferase
MSDWTATMLERDYDLLHGQLFQPDRDEHAAFLYAGLTETARGRRLLVRRVVPVADHEFVPSNRGAYRQIVPRAVARAALECDELGLCLLWAHSHPYSGDAVEFSSDDLAAHAYAHPALIDMSNDRPVAGLVLGENAVAGEVWAAGEDPTRLSSLRVVGRNLKTLTPRQRNVGAAAERFARQVMMFGAPGQQILREMTVVVVGAGGGGSLLVEMLTHLGVGRIVVIDYDVVDESNLSRIVGATPDDVGRLKVDVARDHAARIDPDVVVDAVYGDIAYIDDARLLVDADFAFVATDNILSRYAFNLICHQFLIPGIQVGAKVTGDADGGIELIHVMERPVTLEGPCLDCAGAIPAAALTREQLSPEARRAQGYVDGDDGADIDEPSVITLNSISTSLAATDFLLMATGLMPKETSLEVNAYYPQERELRAREYVKRPGCRFCGDGDKSALGRGDLKALSLKPGARPPRPVPPPASASPPPAAVRGGVIARAGALLDKVIRRHDDAR